MQFADSVLNDEPKYASYSIIQQMGYFITIFFARSSLYVGKYKSRLNYFRLLWLTLYKQ